MADHVYGSLELTGSSKEGTDQAVRAALAKAQTLVSNIRWFEVLATRGYVQDGQTLYWQVTIKVGYTLE
jgi:flavin-binding protein dodecin